MSIKSNAGDWFDRFFENLDYGLAGKTVEKGRELSTLERFGRVLGGEEEARKIMTPFELYNKAHEMYHGKDGLIRKAKNELTKLQEDLSGIQGDEAIATHNQKIKDKESQIENLHEQYKEMISPGGERGGRIIDRYGPANIKHLIDFMNAGEIGQVATKYGVAGGVIYGASSIISAFTGD